ncbi:hypothetical protein BSL78_24844 [Apostichopus japonicus]|uniref:F-box domain-containing protein n=1 Tax=Stichopus japonicus TaxID=307972 RepID=A0A2G8JRB4_STIJA|nr:hypothetical protein BSL78_24844 [Apostichopus japonicus]
MDDDGESVLMRKISDFNPASHEDVSVTGNGRRIPNGVGTVGSLDGNGSRNPAFRPGFATTHNSNGNVEPQDCIPSERQSESERRDLKSTGLLKNGRRKKSRDVRDVPSKVQTGSTSQYKSRWPLSSSLIPSRPSRTNPRRFSPERKMDRRVRPASAKVTRGGGSKEDAMKGQRLRPKSAVSEKKSKEPDESGDFFQVRSSMMFDGSINRSSTTGPLTLQLISDSPRERRTLSIWQLLPDEILLTIFSHLKPSDLLACSLTCQGFYRVAMDESLWKVIRLEKKLLTDFYLTQIGLKHPSRVIFSQCQGKTVTENGLRNLFRTCVDSLQELNFSGCTGEMFSGDSVLLHASRCYNLSSIDASWCNVTDNGLNAVTGGANRLSSVCLNGCQSVTDTGLRSLVERHGSSLIEFEVFGCIDLSPLTLTRIGDVCKNLHSLNIGQCYKVTFESLFEVIPKLKALRHLDVRGCKQGLPVGCGHVNSAGYFIHKVTSQVTMYTLGLSSVCLNGCQSVTDTGLRSLVERHGSSLIEFEVFGCIDLSPLTLTRIGDVCKNLHSLNIGQCYKVTFESLFEVIPKLKALRHLDVRGCKQMRDDCVRRIAKCCKRLETLVMANCNLISNVSMVDIAANLKTIRSLDVSGCKKITNEGVRSVAMCCIRLEAFNLSSTSIDRKSISTLASYCSQNLRDLKLNCCKDITEASIVKLLKHCRSLETLHLYGVKGLRNLGLLKLQYPCLMYE